MPTGGRGTTTVLVHLEADMSSVEGQFTSVSKSLDGLERKFKKFAEVTTKSLSGVNKELEKMVKLTDRLGKAGRGVGPGGAVIAAPRREGAGIVPTGGAAPAVGGGAAGGRGASGIRRLLGGGGMAAGGAIAGGALLAGIGALLAGTGAAIQWAISTGAKGVSAAERYEQAQRYLPGMGMGGGTGALTGYGIGPTQAAQMRTQAGRQMGGDFGPKGPEYYAMSAGMGMGVDFGQAAGFMGTGRRGGITGKSQFAMMEKVYATAMQKGLDKAVLTDYLKEIQSISESQLEKLGTLSESRMVEVAGLTTSLAQRANLDITQAGGIMGKVSRGIQTPGGGEAGQMFMLRAMGFGNPMGATGPQRTYFQAMKKQEEGLRESNFSSVMSQLNAEYGEGSEASAMALKEIFGVSLHQAEHLQKMWEEGKSQTEISKEIKEINEDNTPHLEKLAKNVNMSLSSMTAALEGAMINLGQALVPVMKMIRDIQLRAIGALTVMVRQLNELVDWARLPQDIKTQAQEALLGGAQGAGPVGYIARKMFPEKAKGLRGGPTEFDVIERVLREEGPEAAQKVASQLAMSSVIAEAEERKAVEGRVPGRGARKEVVEEVPTIPTRAPTEAELREARKVYPGPRTDPGVQKGGIITRPTTALLHGGEAVIPFEGPYAQKVGREMAGAMGTSTSDSLAAAQVSRLDTIAAILNSIRDQSGGTYLPPVVIERKVT